jgi:DNA topoisomerase-1
MDMARDTAEFPASAEAAGLCYGDDGEPGYRRIRHGEGFTYRDPEGQTVRDPDELDRIRSLVIPPAWTDVWICPLDCGHIQATGRDQKGRKQYRYHPRWREVRDASKYGRVTAFGRALPRLRRRVERDLALPDLPREKVLAAVVRLLEVTLIRVGNDEYARDNKSFGLTTLRKRHLTLSGAGAIFEFRGKSGKVHRTGFRDARLARVVKACQDLRGQRLFQYRDEAGELRPVESSDINDYIRAAIGDDFSAKDFRTWAGTVSAARALCLQGPPRSEAEARRAVATCIKAVAGLLGNTPAVCRAAYVHPAVVEAYSAGKLDQKPAGAARPFEMAVIRLLEAS